MMNDREKMLQEMDIWNNNLKVDVSHGDLQDLADCLIEAGFVLKTIERCPVCGSKMFPHLCGGSSGWSGGGSNALCSTPNS